MQHILSCASPGAHPSASSYNMRNDLDKARLRIHITATVNHSPSSAAAMNKEKPDTSANPAESPSPAENGRDDTKSFPDRITDGQFSIKITEDMTLRNLLRSGLVEAQGKEQNLIPLYVSWPHWLKDGIICMYASDFQRVLDDAIKDMALTVKEVFAAEPQGKSADQPVGEHIPGDVQPASDAPGAENPGREDSAELPADE